MCLSGQARGHSSKETAMTDTETATEISTARGRIDDLDARIIALVQERTGVSAEIQQARIESGGRRVHLSREMEVIARYSGELGRPGTTLAMTLLELCRGRI
ncbi:chorismate mutase [Actinacidiphila oryziradicis]|uniref:chorismate mutase n=1 Tax=Actinacidiphila oryziradicis TaxID=2571141 RepID=UPI0023F4C8A8|nr:chorismate mutase [Actinacidiphila oryziradicis]